MYYNIIDAQKFLFNEKNILWDGQVLKSDPTYEDSISYKDATPLDFNNAQKGCCKMTFMDLKDNQKHQEVYLLLNDYQLEIYGMDKQAGTDKPLYDFSDDWCGYMLGKKDYGYACSVYAELKERINDRKKKRVNEINKLNKEIEEIEGKISEVNQSALQDIDRMESLQQQAVKVVKEHEKKKPADTM